jgi:hypothetical protein
MRFLEDFLVVFFLATFFLAFFFAAMLASLPEVLQNFGNAS